MMRSHRICCHAVAVTTRSLLFGAVLGFVLMTAQRAHSQPGWVLSHQKISDTEGDFTGILDDVDFFGYAVASLGDLDGDGVIDMAVGASEDDDGSSVGHGAVWILFLNADGTVKSHQKISATQGGFTGFLYDHGNFGYSLASLGDLDGDDVCDLAVGNVQDSDGGSFRGAVWVLFLNTDGTVKTHQKISDTQGNFTGILDNGDRFGSAVASMGDHDGDGVGDLAVAAFEDTDGGSGRGAVWVLFLNNDGTVKSHQKISNTQGDFTGIMDDWDYFGWSVGSLGDLDGDDVGDIVVGAVGDDDGGTTNGAIWMLFLNADGTVKAHQKISEVEGGFTGVLDIDDWFGYSVPLLGDLDGDGVSDLAVGAAGDDDGGAQHGAVWVLFLNTDGTVKGHQKISTTEGGFTGNLDSNDWFATSTASLGDLDGNGVNDLVVGARGDDDGGPNRGAVWVLFLDGVSSSSTATLTNFDIETGVLLDGVLADLESSDDSYVHTRSGFGRTLVDLHNMEMIVNAETTVDAPNSLNLTIESRIDEPAGLAQIRMRNWNTNQFESVGSYSISNSDQIDTIEGIDATNYVDDSGNIDLSIKHLVFVPFLAFTFESFVDQVEIVVE